MHSSRMCTILCSCSGCLSCHTCPTMHTPCHTQPPATHAPCHTCPLPCTPPAMHTPLPQTPLMHSPHHTCSPATHALLQCMPSHHTCPLPCMSPCHAHPPNHTCPLLPCMPLPLTMHALLCHTHLPLVDKMTDACENTTFLKLLLRMVIGCEKYLFHLAWLKFPNSDFNPIR